MPINIKHNCNYPGCRSLTDKRFCDRHNTEQKQAMKVYNSYIWKSLRRLVLTNEPLCRTCNANGTTRIATQVDHINPISQGGSPFDQNNLQPLCDSCHSRKTAREVNERERQQK